MLLSKALDLTDTVTDSVTSHLPAPLAGPLHLAVSTITWVPRRVVGGVEHLVDHGRSTTPRDGSTDSGPAGDTGSETAGDTGSKTAGSDGAAPQGQDAAPQDEAPAPDVVLTLDRPAEEVEPPVDVVGEALSAEAAEQPPAHQDDEHVELAEDVVFTTSTDDPA